MERTDEIIELLEKEYPDAHCELNHRNPFELLVAVILSAQCTDKRVNQVTAELFKTLATPKDFASVDAETLERLIFSCGFYRNKARNIILASRAIVEKHGGSVPTDFDTLLTLPGVGRKTANVVTSVAFGGEGIAVDTHVFRVSNRLGLANGKTPFEVEKALTEALSPEKRARAHHLLIFHGRYRCKSLSPICGDCSLKKYCLFYERERKNV